MRINVCVNGTFRYPAYIRHYEAAGALNAFYFAHRPSARGRALGLRAAESRNVWAKEVALQAAWRGVPSRWLPAVSTRICDHFQREVIRHWRPCDSVEAVIGAVADRVIAFAKPQGCRVLGHAVMSHPDTVERLLARAYADLGLDPRRSAFPDRVRRLAEIAACDRILVDSAFAARSFLQHGVPADRIAVVTPALDTSRFAPRDPDERDRAVFRVVCVGAITPRKGQHLLLQAWRRLRLPRAELVLVGRAGRDARSVLRGFEDRATHIPSIPHAALRALLIRCSVFVAPSIEDGFAQAPLEAMACGLPVIVSEAVGMADLVTDGVDGFVVPAFDADAIADRLEELYRHAERAAAMGQAAAAAASRVGSWAGYVDWVLAEHRHMLTSADRREERAA